MPIVRWAILLGYALPVCLTGPARLVEAAAAPPVVLAFYDGDTGDYAGLARLDRQHVTHLASTGLYLAADGGLHAVRDAKTLVQFAHQSEVRVLQMVQNYRDGAFQAGAVMRLGRRSPSRPPPSRRPQLARRPGGWHLTVYYTPVESYHGPPLRSISDCGGVALGQHSTDFLDHVRTEGFGRVATPIRGGR